MVFLPRFVTETGKFGHSNRARCSSSDCDDSIRGNYNGRRHHGHRHNHNSHRHSSNTIRGRNRSYNTASATMPASTARHSSIARKSAPANGYSL